MTQQAIVQRVAMKAVIAKDGKLLLLRESAEDESNFQAGKYQFPGGRLDAGEPFAEGLKREVREETGMEIVIGRPLFVGEWFPIIKGVPHQIVATFLVCEPILSGTMDIPISEEHDDYRWVTLEEARQINVMKPDNQVVELYFSSLSA